MVVEIRRWGQTWEWRIWWGAWRFIPKFVTARPMREVIGEPRHREGNHDDFIIIVLALGAPPEFDRSGFNIICRHEFTYPLERVLVVPTPSFASILWII
jgi:hypothetical protein